MSYLPDPQRYDRMPYRRVGDSGLKLPALSLGLWQNFGDDRPLDDADVRRRIMLRVKRSMRTHPAVGRMTALLRDVARS